MDKIYQKAKEVIYKKIENEVAIVPALDAEEKIEKPWLFYLEDPTSVKIWELVDGKRSISQIIDEIAKLFNTERDEIKHDVVNFISELKDNNLISKKR